MLTARLSFIVCLLMIVVLPYTVSAFGAGNIASISKIKGHNWRHGDIEDMLKNIRYLHGNKWTSMMIKRVYFGNWLRDYSQALDVGTLKGVQAGTIKLLIWILAFMSFGYATGEFEVTDERLGVYRPEEHIDNPRDYADNQDARHYDSRLRGPVSPEELAVDPRTGLKNYIANEDGSWATSLGYVKFSLARSIHFGRVYTSGSSGRGHEEDICEALRCLGQGLHCLEDFGAHTNYTELALRELGYHNVFCHTGSATEIQLQGKFVFPLVTGTFGGVDFLHSVLGEANDHVTQSEVDEVNKALGDASIRMRGYGGGSISAAKSLTDLLSKVPGTGHLCREAFELQADSDAQALQNTQATKTEIRHSRCGGPQNISELPGEGSPAIGVYSDTYPGPQPPAKPAAYGGTEIGASTEGYGPGSHYGSQASHIPDIDDNGSASYNQGVYPGPPSTSNFSELGNDAQSENISELPVYPGPPNIVKPHSPESTPEDPAIGTSVYGTATSSMGLTLDPEATIRKIYPILVFRDTVVRTLASIVENIPGLEKLIETIQEQITFFIMSLLAPYIQPVINMASSQLKLGSSAVVTASRRHQFEPWTDPNCTDPTHSLLSKDHFSNILNEPAGQVASAILQYVAPRVVYAWENPGVPVDEILNDIARIFHHPAIRDGSCEIHQNMFDVVRRWAAAFQGDLNSLLSSESVKAGRNHVQTTDGKNSNSHAGGAIFGLGSHSKVSGGPLDMFGSQRALGGDGGSYSTSYQQGAESPMQGQHFKGSVYRLESNSSEQQDISYDQQTTYLTYQESHYASQQSQQ